MNTNDKIQEVELQIVSSKQQVESVLVNALERGDKLEDLENKAEELKDAGSMFEKATTQLKRSMWWKKAKPLVIIGVAILVIIAIAVIIVAI